MDFDLYREIIGQAKDLGVEEVGLYLLGEPLLVGNLPDFVRHARKSGIGHVFITTNGLLATPDRILPLIDAGLTSIKYSVNGHTPERYKEMHGVNGFHTVLQNIRWLASHLRKTRITSIRTAVSTIFLDTFSRPMQVELYEFLDIMRRYVDDAYFLPLYNQGGHIGGMGYTKIVGNPGRWDSLVPPVPCWQLFNAAKVTWDGKFNACCFDHANEFIVEDLRKATLRGAWEHPRFIELRRQHLENDLGQSPCARCLGLEVDHVGRSETTGPGGGEGCPVVEPAG